MVTRPADGAYLAASPIQVDGSAEPGSTVSLEVGGVVSTATAGSAGIFVIGGVGLSEGPNTLLVRAADEAGNLSLPSAVAVTLDTIAPAAPALGALPALTTAPVLGLGGTAEPGVRVTASLGGAAAAEGWADAGGAFELSLTLAEGENTITVRATDLAGNASADASAAVHLDTRPPAAVGALAALPGNARVTLTWENPADADFAGTIIVRTEGPCVDGAPAGVRVYDGSGERFVDFSVENCRDYCYRVSSYDRVPLFSEAVAAAPRPMDTTPPAWTRGDRPAAKVESGRVTLFWNAAVDAASAPVSYTVYYAEQTPVDPAAAVAVTIGAAAPAGDFDHHLVVDGLTDGRDYYFLVRAADAACEPNLAESRTVHARPHQPAQAFLPVADAFGLDTTSKGVRAALGDVDGDDDDDFFLTILDKPCRLYRNDGGRFTEIGHVAGVDGLASSKSGGAAFLDYDLDGDLDLYVAVQSGANRLYANNGGSFFFDVAGVAGVADAGVGKGCLSGDFDADGHADLYLVNDGPNRHFRNGGQGVFADVTAGEGGGDSGQGTGAVLGDFDGDGDPDPYVTNKTGDNVLYRNEAAALLDVTAVAGASCTDDTYAAAFGDVDADGDLDLYLVNSGAPNRLLRNDGSGQFTDVTEAAGVALTAMGRDAKFADVDHDGDLDLYVVNNDRSNVLYRNLGGGLFEDATEAFALGDAGAGMAGLFWDVDQDGDLDLSVINSSGSRLYLNPADDNEFLIVKVEPAAGNAFGAGAVAELYPRGQAGVAGALLGSREITPPAGPAIRSRRTSAPIPRASTTCCCACPAAARSSRDVPAGGVLRVLVE